MARHSSYLDSPSAWGGHSMTVWGLPRINVTDRRPLEGQDPLSGNTVSGVQVMFSFPFLGDMRAWVSLEQWPEGEEAAILAVYRQALADWRARARATYGRAAQIPDLQPKFP